MRIKFTKSQWNRLSEILGNLGIFSLGSMVVPYLFGNNPDGNFIIAGLAITIWSWYTSLVFAKKY